jgi:phosphoribosylamine--glycine ligase
MLGPDAVFGEAGSEVVIEEFMEGEEASVFAVCDGERYVLLPAAQDHKRAFDGDLGPNTGGMGAYAPAPLMTPRLLDQVCREVVEPTLAGMRAEGCPYAGVLYVGVMVTAQGPKVVEFNCRLGDPETQCVLPLYEGDLADLFLKAATGRITASASPAPRGSAVVIVLASGGYPGPYKNGFPISGPAEAEAISGVQVLHAGTALKGGPEEGVLVTAGGRVLQEALDIAYMGVSKISFEGMHFRKDIGKKGLKAE